MPRMKKRCSMITCGVVGGKQFSFPRNTVRAEIWKKLCANPKLDRVCVSRLFYQRSVCKKHFARNQFQNDLMERLISNAVPCLFLPFSNSDGTISCTSSNLPEDTKAPNNSVVELNWTLPDENQAYTNGISELSFCNYNLGSLSLPLGSNFTTASDRLAESETVRDSNLSLVNTQSNEDVGAVIDTKGVSALNISVNDFEGVTPPVESVVAMCSDVMPNSESQGNQTLPVVNVGNNEGLQAVIDSEKLSSQITPSRVTGDGNDESSNEDNDFGENIPSFLLDTHSTAQCLHGDQGTQLPLLDSTSTEGFIYPLNNYYRYTICRLCFCSRGPLTGIFEERDGNEFVISEAIEDLLQFKVSKADDFPLFICHECLKQLVYFKKFKDKLCKLKKKFEESLQKLRTSSCESDKDAGDMACGQFEGLSDEGQRETEEAAIVEHANMLKDMTENYLPEDSEGFSQSEDALTDLEDTGMEESDASETETKEEVPEEENKCYECGKTFEFKNILTLHLKEHRKDWKFICRYCDKRFKTLINLNSHIVVHSDYKPYECEHCGLRCRLKASLAKHKMVHSGDKPFLCSVCGLNFRERIQLKYHMKEHLGNKDYKCLECGKEFYSNARLKSHIAMSHKKDKSYVCGDCGKSFKNVVHLNNHVTCVHQKEKRFKCGICSKLFSLRLYLKNHMKIHNRNKL
ncbi:zinc finger protein 436-like [Ischnura elegans]|uniref:zinc finger protein 436-like n=1 Tax=Ischnura elegans TaxID=197161 RepID=UPI001ED8A9BA|nr:zinc finger protein 436-like [Ischnura elegans]